MKSVSSISPALARVDPAPDLVGDGRSGRGPELVTAPTGVVCCARCSALIVRRRYYATAPAQTTFVACFAGQASSCCEADRS